MSVPDRQSTMQFGGSLAATGLQAIFASAGDAPAGVPGSRVRPVFARPAGHAGPVGGGGDDHALLVARVAELSASNDALEALVFAIAHDMGGPLHAIDSYGARLARRVADGVDPEAVFAVDRIRHASAGMGDAVADLLEFSRLSCREPVWSDLDLSAMAREIALQLAATAPGRRIDWAIRPGLCARGDAGLMRLALMKLIDNAFKFTRDASTARIEVGGTDRSGAGQEFFVRDNGIGFDMRFARQLFQPFGRLRDSDKFEGLGIGLAIVERIIRRHGGQVRAGATRGAGATFSFSLPAPGCAQMARPGAAPDAGDWLLRFRAVAPPAAAAVAPAPDAPGRGGACTRAARLARELQLPRRSALAMYAAGIFAIAFCAALA